MSQENIEFVRRGYERMNQTGEPDYALLDPEVVIDVSRRTFDPLIYHGHQGARDLATLIQEQWASMRVEPQEFIDAGDTVVVSVRLVGVGKQSGVKTTANAAHIWTFRDGKVVRQTIFQSMDEALEAAGLRE